MKQLYKITFIALVLMTAAFFSSAQALRGTSIDGSRTKTTAAPNRLINPVYLVPDAVLFTDNFDGPNDTTGLKARGYRTYYRGSGPPGVQTIWYQGIATVFTAFNGSDSSYLASNYNSVTGANTINNWLVLPKLNIGINDTLSFYSHAPLASAFPDSIKVMYSVAGDSVPEAASWVMIGQFKVNTAGIWERRTFNAPAAGATGRFAIRYSVVDGGPLGNNSDYIGIDQLDVIQSALPLPCDSTRTFAPALAITDNDPVGVNDAQTIGMFGTALGTDIFLTEVCFNITHTWVGDLIVTLTGPNGVPVVLMDRPGVPLSSTVGCAGDDVDACVDLGTGNEMEDVCGNLPAIFGTYTAANGSDLNAINLGGGSAAGTWTLSISDNAAIDTGILNSWSLSFSSGPFPSWAANPDTVCSTGGNISLSPMVTGTAGGTWSGSGVTGTTFNPTGLSGSIAITYTVTNGNCTNAETHNIFVEAGTPVCAFTASIANMTATFTNTTTGATLGYSWDFGDGSAASTDANPTHTYLSNSTYTVTLSSTNSCGTSTCTQVVVINGCPDVIVDGGFELGPGSGAWTETSTNFGTPLCDVGSCGLGGGTGPKAGTFWAWFGGIPSTFEEGTLTQSVTLAAGTTASLNFYLEQPVCDNPGDFMYVVVDADTVFRTDGSSPLCAVLAYSLQTVDLSIYCDGLSHSIQFYSITLGTNGTATNFFVDDVSLLVCPKPTAIDEALFASHISIAPNPASGMFTISVAEPKANATTIEVYNTMGQMVYSKAVTTTPGSKNISVDASQWSTGVYMVKVKAGDMSAMKKVVVE